MNRNVFFTSDWHVGHTNCIEFDSRPFSNIDHMHSVLINNYNATVRKYDICYFLGDMGLASFETMKSVVGQLNGQKILIFGNHDKPSNQFWYRCGFDALLYMGSVRVGKDTVTMTHCPLRGIKREDVTGMKGAVMGEHWHGERRHTQFSIPNWGQFHLHGHIHSPNDGKSTKIQGRQYDVGVVANNYRPVSFSQIESWIATTRRDEVS